MQLDRTSSRRGIGRLFQMGLPELVFRGRQETFKLVDRMRPIKPVAPRRSRSNQPSLKRFIDHCEKAFFAGAFDDRVCDALSNAHADECQMVLFAADRVFHGKFDLLGYRDLGFGNPIDWHLDAVSGRRATFAHWSRLDPLDAATAGDTKVIWELNRHQWLVHLAQAWRVTRYERYAGAVVQHMQDWTAANPTGMGINWSSSLEVSLRLIAWCWSLVLVRDSEALTTEVFAAFETAIEAHASHVERYLSTYFSPNTHLTGEALGLFYSGILFPDSSRAERWRSLGTTILETEIGRQVRSDGVYFEQSTCYQRYTVDIYLHFLILAKQAGIKVAPAVEKIVQSMLNVLVALRQPDGSMPSIGDADGGLLLPLGMSEPCDYRATFSTAAVVFSDPVYAWAAGTLAPETVWLLGTPAIERFEALPKSAPPFEACQVFPAGGLAIMRSSFDRRAHSLTFDAGPLGCDFSSGHGHADLLSIQCCAFGETYLVDAGTCCYTADLEQRQYFRGTAAHSTLIVDGKPQAEPAGPFSWRSRCSARLLRWFSTDSIAYADAQHDAYHALRDPVSHRRRIAFVKSRYWIVVDDVIGAESHRIDLRFQFAPTMQVRVDDDSWIRASRNGREGLLLRTFASEPFDVNVREGQRDPLEGWVSPDYGRMEPAPAVVFTTTAPLPLRVVTLIWPAESVDEFVHVDAVKDAQGRPSGLTFHDRGETVIFDDEKPILSMSSRA